MTAARRKSSARPPRRQYTGAELMRAAFLAGQGCSGEEIAARIGGTTGPKIRARLRRAGLSMLRRTNADAVLTVSLPSAELAAFEAIADAREIDPAELARKVIVRAITRPAIVDSALSAKVG